MVRWGTKITKGVGVGALNFFPLAKEGKEIWDMEFSSENLWSLHPPSQQSTFP